MKLGVFYPWDPSFSFTAFSDAMMNLQRPEGVETRFFRATGFCPARRHMDGCEKCLDWGADIILIVGADQVLPEDMLV